MRIYPPYWGFANRRGDIFREEVFCLHLLQINCGNDTNERNIRLGVQSWQRYAVLRNGTNFLEENLPFYAVEHKKSLHYYLDFGTNRLEMIKILLNFAPI